MSSVANSSTTVNSSSHSINPDAISNLESKKKKSKKRLRDEERTHADETLAEQGGKKKKRKHDKEKSGGTAHETPSNNVEPVQEATSVKKKKKKEKDKAKEKEVIPLAEQTDAEIEANSQASAAVLLSAIVATMSNPQGTLPQMQPPIPYGSGQFLPFPPMSFGFPVPTDGAAHSNAFSNLAINPGLNGGPLSELASGSNNDILRALQEIDIGKLTAALKHIGGTGGDNTPALPSPQLPSMPLGTTPEAGQISIHVNSSPNGPAKKAVSKNGHKRTIDMSLPGGEQHIDPVHAHMLATKWLNASKLAELVREEGTTSINHQA